MRKQLISLSIDPEIKTWAQEYFKDEMGISLSAGIEMVLRQLKKEKGENE